MRAARGVVFLALFLAMVTAFAYASDQNVVDAIIVARTSVKPLANPSSLAPGLTLQKAYEIQKRLAEKLVDKGDKVAGFKAGLTSEGAQKKFKTNGALLGPLFASGKVEPSGKVAKKGFVRMFIETEVGYVVGKKITKPVKDVKELKTYIGAIVPAIELPDIRFADMKKLNAADIAADAVGSAKFIVGKPVAMGENDVNEVATKLSLDGKPLMEGKGSDALGDQWKALLWLVNGAVEKGWTIEPNSILITGALGKLTPAKPGKYLAEYGKLGSISFTVE